jgi:hypothetical protein
MDEQVEHQRKEVDVMAWFLRHQKRMKEVLSGNVISNNVGDTELYHYYIILQEEEDRCWCLDRRICGELMRYCIRLSGELSKYIIPVDLVYNEFTMFPKDIRGLIILILINMRREYIQEIKSRFLHNLNIVEKAMMEAIKHYCRSTSERWVIEREVEDEIERKIEWPTIEGEIIWERFIGNYVTKNVGWKYECTKIIFSNFKKHPFIR